MRGFDDEQRAGAMWQFEQHKGRFWGRTGLSAEAVYWVIFTLGLAVLSLLIVEILGSLAS